MSILLASISWILELQLRESINSWVLCVLLSNGEDAGNDLLSMGMMDLLIWAQKVWIRLK